MDDGSVWVVYFGSNKLAHIDPETLAHEEIELPRSAARPRRLEVLADGRIWYVDYAKGMLGDRLDRESRLPTASPSGL